MNPNDKPPPRDYRAEVTADIIRMLEEGTAPWQKPWEASWAGRPIIRRPASRIAAETCSA